MWTSENRSRYDRSKLRYLSDLTDAEWALVKTSDPHGYDAGKRIKGKKRHVLVDTQGLLMQAIVHTTDLQDRDGGVPLMAS